MTEPRRIDAPETGYWMIRLVKGGPEIPAAIMRVQTTHEPGNESNVMERSAFLAAFVNGEPADIDIVWHRRGRVITEAEYRFQVADSQWARRHAPHEPKAQPRKAVDLTKLDPIF